MDVPPAPASNGHRVVCCYGDPPSYCGAVFMNASPKEVQDHITGTHLSVEHGERTNCKWCIDPISGTRCGDGLLKAQVGKHVCGVHLKMFARRCPHCLRDFSRPDALKRHLANDNIECGRKVHG
ncbi:hypothetical protein DAEQUDRAFT_729267 [Daedalea quercina L-15889]|uniref:C2H2-type domain-containing protein n=1 Tax=Daedalea quercina L-15889 TaxID=1314783 RepID=A0A165NQ31_9APHY|nr:hypothetical protein DAEQUDRAFT_729267 [Daedalea quercina L-15889]